LLKITGVVQSHLWFEIGLPVGGFIITIGAFFQDFYKSMNNIYNNLSKDINKITISISILNTKFEHLEKDMDFIKKKI